MTARILLVDDEELNRKLLEAMLGAEGYELVEAADGAAGLATIAAGGIDLVLLDVMMPGLSGFDVCHRIREDLGLTELPVIIVTALGDRAARIRGKEVGADEFLTKPVDDVELLVRVRSLLRAKAAHDAKERQRRLMSAILDSMTEGVVAADEVDGYAIVNRAAERILGPLTSWPEPSAWPRKGSTVTPLAAAFTGESPEGIPIMVPGVVVAPRHLSVSARPLPPIAPDDPPGAVAVFRDVSREVELDRFKADMSSLVVHDLKNAMVAIGANIEYALEVGPGGEDGEKPLTDARDACYRAIRLIANLMDVSRMEEAGLQLRPESVDLAVLAESALRPRMTLLRSRGVEVRIDIVPGKPVQADADLLQRVVENILDNAVRYVPPDGRIVLSAPVSPDGSLVQLRIGNSGPPIPPDHRASIFGKYRQAGMHESRTNAGLGLYFCQLAVEAHGGQIWVDSVDGLPTVFVLELPSVLPRPKRTSGSGPYHRQPPSIGRP